MLCHLNRGTVVSEPDMTLFLKILMERKVEGDGCACIKKQEYMTTLFTNLIIPGRRVGGWLCVSQTPAWLPLH